VSVGVHFSRYEPETLHTVQGHNDGRRVYARQRSIEPMDNEAQGKGVFYLSVLPGTQVRPAT
jgi:hypothetical protein